MSKEFTPAEAMEFFQKMWNPLGLQMPGMMPPIGAQGGAGAMPPFMPFPPNAMNPFMNFDPEEVERKIGEFKAVETWLNMQIGMLQMTIKTMEMQKASLETLRAQTQNAGGGQGTSRKEKS
ncbi:MAG: PhaM family polyhydroxyalkanoate granule multifunctional regulatory protein [Casimicrobiaceae bacterium]